MLTLILWAIAPAPIPGAPSLALLDDLSPAAIGEVVLRGRDHGVIERVAPDRGLDPPGVVRLKLTERPSRISGGCVRKQWTASFVSEPGKPESSATLKDAYSAFEVALPNASGCANGQFAYVSPRMSVEHAVGALGHLRNLLSGKTKVRFSCTDSTGSDLCRTSKAIRRELARLPAWAVTRKDGEIEIWLGQPGQIVTAVRYSETSPDQIRVDRRIPAPF
jgi:hypothetical protein